MPENLDLSATVNYWDEHGLNIYQNRAEWLAHPLVQAHQRNLRGGKNLGDWLISNYLPPTQVGYAVGIGTGVAEFELNLMWAGRVRHYDLYDVSSISLEAAREAVRQSHLEGQVRVFCQDLNELDLPQNHYGLATFIQSLHHVTELEKVLSQIYAALQPGGMLFANEYVGPNRFAFPETHNQLARQLYRVLDSALRCPWPELPLPNPLDVTRADPTEAVHSEEIIGVVNQVFDEVEVLPLGGALAHVIWYGFNHEAIYDTEQGQELVRTILELDQALFTSGRLPSYFSHIVARKKTIEEER